jgi:predicted metal-dependent hydrolase
VRRARSLLGRRLKVAPRTIRIQRMTRKWGSCSSSGRITLADDLMERSSDFQAFVIVHELLHLRVQIMASCSEQ